MTKELKISKDLSLPVKAVTEKLAWLGTTGSGKTYGASAFAEHCWRIGAQFVVLDPVGVWYGLRLAKDGKKPSDINIPIFGGLHGDVPLESTGGELLANLIVDKGLSCIIDVSQFETDTEKTRFTTDFVRKLFFRKKAMPSAMHLFLEECQEFVPQNPQKGEERMLHSFVTMQKLGRNFGIGSSYISQRPQDVSKKALNMAQTLFVFRTTGSQERTAIQKWIEDKSLDENIAQDLPKIPTGQCHVWSPEFLKISKIIKISEKQTFNASATPEVGAAAKARHLAPIDLAKVRSEMAATIEKAKKEDPKELQKKIIQLEAEMNKLKKFPLVSVPNPEDVIKKIKAAVGANNKEWNKIIQSWKNYAEKVEKYYRDLVHEGERHFDLIASHKPIAEAPQDVEILYPKNVDMAKPGEERTIKTTIEYPKEGQPKIVSAEDITMTKGEITVMKAVAQFQEEGITNEHIAILTGYKKTSRVTYIQSLAQKGYIKKSGNLIFPTREGIEDLGSNYEPLPTGKELRDYVLGTLPEGERKVLNVILEAYPGFVGNEQIEEATQYKKTSRVTYVQKLLARKLIVRENNLLKASDKLYD